ASASRRLAPFGARPTRLPWGSPERSRAPRLLRRRSGTFGFGPFPRHGVPSGRLRQASEREVVVERRGHLREALQRVLVRGIHDVLVVERADVDPLLNLNQPLARERR